MRLLRRLKPNCTKCCGRFEDGPGFPGPFSLPGLSCCDLWRAASMLRQSDAVKGRFAATKKPRRRVAHKINRSIGRTPLCGGLVVLILWNAVTPFCVGMLSDPPFDIPCKRAGGCPRPLSFALRNALAHRADDDFDPAVLGAAVFRLVRCNWCILTPAIGADPARRHARAAQHFGHGHGAAL